MGVLFFMFSYKCNVILYTEFPVSSSKTLDDSFRTYIQRAKTGETRAKIQKQTINSLWNSTDKGIVQSY